MCAAHLLPLMMLDLFWNKNEAHDYLLAACHTHEKLARVGPAFGGLCDGLALDHGQGRVVVRVRPFPSDCNDAEDSNTEDYS